MRHLLIFILIPFFIFAKGVTASAPVTGMAPTIVLDAGHGGGYLGAHIRDPYTVEKRLTLSTTLMVKKFLEGMGYRVVLTRSRDVFVSLPQRVYIANRSNAEIFVSIHFNSCPAPSIKGVEVFYSDFGIEKRFKASKTLARNVLFSILAKTGTESRGIKKGNYYVLRHVKMPAILVEGGFMTNAAELNQLRQSEYLEKIAKGLAEGIDKFSDGVKKSNP